MSGAAGKPCVFCQIARSSTSTTLLYSDERIVAFQDINPSAFRHYLVIPVDHIATANDLRRTSEDYQLVKHMLNVGQTLLRQDAPQSHLYRFGFHRPPCNSVNHLHLHCLALPFIPRLKQPVENLNYVDIPHGCYTKRLLQFMTLREDFVRWKTVKYASLGPLGGFIEAEKLLEKIKPPTEICS